MDMIIMFGRWCALMDHFLAEGLSFLPEGFYVTDSEQSNCVRAAVKQQRRFWQNLRVDFDGSPHTHTHPHTQKTCLLCHKHSELFMEMWLRRSHLQRSHPVWAVHVEPEAQVTQADAGGERAPGGYRGDVALLLRRRVHVQEVPSTTLGENVTEHICVRFT